MFPLSHFSFLSTIPQTHFQGIFQVRIDGRPVYCVYYAMIVRGDAYGLPAVAAGENSPRTL